MKFMITAVNKKFQESNRHSLHGNCAKCSLCMATVMTSGESVPDSEIGGIDERTGILICRHCVETYMTENRMTA